MRNFKELLIWQRVWIYGYRAMSYQNFFLKEERFGLTSQINRASSSILQILRKDAAGKVKKILLDLFR